MAIEAPLASSPKMRFLYRIYAYRLMRRVRGGPLPKHVGIILDGNRRYARRKQIDDPRDIYQIGAGKLDEVLAWCAEIGIKAITLWVCSTENLARPEQEVSGILRAVETKLSNLADDPWIHRRGIRVRAAGKLDVLPLSTREAISAAEAATRDYEAMTLTIAVAYGGREEIVDAMRSFLKDQALAGAELGEVAELVTTEAIGRYVYVPDLPDPDLIIRTSGETRLSGFLLWQSAYSEFYFCDVFWPAFRKIDLLRAVRSYQQRQRRFGR